MSAVSVQVANTFPRFSPGEKAFPLGIWQLRAEAPVLNLGSVLELCWLNQVRHAPPISPQVFYWLGTNLRKLLDNNTLCKYKI